jgi:uncharacterized protein with PIN domain
MSNDNYDNTLTLQLKLGICPECVQVMREASDKEMSDAGWEKTSPEDRYWYCKYCNYYTFYSENEDWLSLQ